MITNLPDINDIDINKPIYIMLIGTPCSGKSQYISDHIDFFNNFNKVSTDDIIEREAKKDNKSYSAYFSDTAMKKAIEEFWSDMNNYIIHSKNILDDQTNTTINGRKKKLSTISEKYTRIAIVFNTDYDIILERNIQRNISTGKLIPEGVIKNMYDNIFSLTEEKLLNEGFNKVYFVVTN